jgi:(1->4)-alpha-D-glucan 1-alpha-D-glucosylmutase
MPAPPLATYRLQLRPSFGFEAAASIVPHLSRLGVSHVYASPILEAAPGSEHGYDVVDPTRARAELGGEEGFVALTDALAGHDMGIVVDIVPNHLATDASMNPWWRDVLAHGQASRYADYFDIDWAAPGGGEAKVLLPLLGDHIGRCLERGEIVIRRSGGAFAVAYFEHDLPLAPETADGILAAAALRTGSDELAFLAHSLERLPRPTTTDVQSRWERFRDARVVEERLAELCEDRSIAGAVDHVLADLNRRPDELDALLRRQPYRLARWTVADQELDYRRFFDINSLIALRMEDDRVFDDVHAKVREWFEAGRIQGIRVDHIDGLRDPEGYLNRLGRAVPGAWVVVEKILLGDEMLQEGWPAAGTTGYDFLNEVTGVMTDRGAEAALTALYERFTGDGTSFDTTAHRARLEVLRAGLAADLERLTLLLAGVCDRHPRHRDHTRAELRRVLAEVLASSTRYRTYVRGGGSLLLSAAEDDLDEARRACAAVRDRRPDIDGDLVEVVERIWTLQVPGADTAELVERLQQLAGPVMAKGVEDRAFYRYNRLLSLNEVGGSPERFGIPVAEFHERQRRRLAEHPDTMITLSTHDTKRSVDARLRLCAIADDPERFGRLVQKWSARLGQRGSAIDAGTAWMLYQALVAAHPVSPDRLAAFARKAVREAAVHTRWTHPDDAFEAAVDAFARAVVTDTAMAAHLDEDLELYVEAGYAASIAATTLLLTCPGVPDLYQGTESWDTSLVDPDNRRPVDFDLLRDLLEQARTVSAGDAWCGRASGVAKVFVVSRLLELRRRRLDVFQRGAYEPIAVDGGADGVVAFLRGEAVLVAVPVRNLARLPAETCVDVPDGGWRDVLSDEGMAGGEPLRVGPRFARFPAVVLERVDT